MVKACLWWKSSESSAKKHAKKSSIKNIGAPQDPLKILCVGLFLYSEGKEALNIKNFAQSGGVSAQILYVYALFRVHAKGVVLCERACFCTLSTF